jgi:hypothetical protein
VRHDVKQRRIDRAKCDASTAPLAHVHNRRFQPVGVIEETSHWLQDLGAFPGKPGPLARSLEQFHAQCALQDLDLLAQRGLRHTQALGCAAEMTLLGDSHEIPEMAQQPEIYHGSNDNLKLFMDIFWISRQCPETWVVRLSRWSFMTFSISQREVNRNRQERPVFQ